MTAGDTPALSERQKQVLSLIDQRLTIKEIASELNISETRVNQHIDTLKRRLGVNTHRELAVRYQELLAPGIPAPFRKPAGGKTKLPDADDARSSPSWVGDGGLALADVQAFSVEVPWTKASEPRVVPPVLDGKNAVLLRLAVVAVMVLGTLGSLVLVITAADSLTNVVGSRPDRQQTS